MTRTAQYIITRCDIDTLRSVPIPGKSFADLNAAVAEATRLNGFTKYRDQFLMVDVATAFAA